MDQRERARELFGQGHTPAEIEAMTGGDIPANKVRAWRSRYKWDSAGRGAGMAQHAENATQSATAQQAQHKTQQRPHRGAGNLKPQNMRTKPEQREIARQGGIASGEARRRKKTMKMALELALTIPAGKVADAKKLAALGVPVGELTMDDLAAIAIARKAANGDVQAYRAMWQVLGEDAPGTGKRDAESSGLLQAIAEAMKSGDV